MGFHEGSNSCNVNQLDTTRPDVEQLSYGTPKRKPDMTIASTGVVTAVQCVP
jgi:hypothetical protein